MKTETDAIPTPIPISVVKTETDTIPPGFAVRRGDIQSISDIISHLRTTFLPSDFDRAEADLAAREEQLRREISRLKKENLSGGGGANLERAIAAEERLAKATERFAAEVAEKERLSTEVSELRKKLEESEKRIASLENDPYVLGLRISGPIWRKRGRESLITTVDPSPPVEIDLNDGMTSSPSSSSPQQQHNSAAAVISGGTRYENQKQRDWNTFGKFLRDHRPPLDTSRCSGAHVLEFLCHLDQFGKTKVHGQACPFFGQASSPEYCPCPLRQAWGSLDALVGRLRAAFEEHGGSAVGSNPFGSPDVHLYLRHVSESQAKARGVNFDKKKRRKRRPPAADVVGSSPPKDDLES